MPDVISGANPVLKRLRRGLASTALQPVVTAAIQLGTVPLLLHAWGAAKYGDWLTLSAIPAYLALTNLGFGDASGSDMTVQVAAGNRQSALETFQSSLALLLVMCSALLALIVSVVWFVPWHTWMKLSTLSDVEASAVILVLSLYILVAQQSGVLESGFRCDGHFATGTTFVTLLRLFETLVASILGVLSASLLWAALGFLACRTAGTIGYGLLLRKKSPWLTIGLKHAKLATIKRLTTPALGFMALPLANAVTLQGFILLVAASKGSVAVSAFSTLRTLTRVNFQLTTVIAWAIWPELSKAFGKGDIPLARSLHRSAYQASLALSFASGGALWCFGPSVYRLWIHQAVPFDATCFHILVLVTFANSLWFTSSVVAMATNAHQRIAFTLVCASFVALAIGYMVIKRAGLTGAALALLAIDVSMVYVVLSTSLRQLQDRLGDFFHSLLSPPPILLKQAQQPADL